MTTGIENLEIDISSVPLEKRDLPEFHRMTRELKRDLDEKTVDACCKREAGT